MSRNAGKITNTTQKMLENPGLMVGQTQHFGKTEMILRQEKLGQQELVQSETLPTNMGGEESAFEAIGIKLGDPVPDDPLFRYVTLPEGWKHIEHVDHDMWSYIVDQDGNERVAVFYKAAFYDRRAHCDWKARVRTDSKKVGDDWVYFVFDYKKKEVLFDPGPDLPKKEGEFGNPSGNACRVWLEKHPELTKPEYWNAP